MRELKVEDALLYLDQVKCEFGDQPHIYNEFLDIMKTFKTQQIDTPGVIRRVSNLFRGNRRLVLGFNTFLPEGYKIELPEGDGPAVAVYRAPGSTHGIILGPGEEPPPPGAPWPPPRQPPPPPMMQGQGGPPHPTPPGMPPGGGAAAASGGRPPPPAPQPREGTLGQGGVLHMHGPPPPLQQGPGGGGPQPPPQAPRPGGLGPPPGSQPPPSMAGLKGPPMAQQQHPAPGNAPHMNTMGDAKNPPGPRPGWPPSYQEQQDRMAQQYHHHQQQQQHHHHQQQPQPPQQHIQPAVNGGPGRGYADGYASLEQPQHQQHGPPGLKQPALPPHQQHSMQPPQQQQQQQQEHPPGHHQVPQQQPPPQQPPPAAAGAGEGQGVVEFDHAINYVTTIKKRFSNEPTTYKKFLEILHTYQKEQRGIKEVLEEVSTLFADHPDLLKEFTYFLPDAVQAQAKAQLEIVAKEAEARKRIKARHAIMSQAQTTQKQAQAAAVSRGGPPAPPMRPPAHEYDRSIPVPFGASQGRTQEQESAIIRTAHYGIVSFAPVRPPRRNQPTPQQAAAKLGRPRTIPELPVAPNTAEASFFQRAKEHLSRKELAADKPLGFKRHTPYTEFLKCLHLYGAGILRKDELSLLLKGLFMQGHAPKSGVNVGGANAVPAIASTASELLRELDELMIGRGPYAEQETTYKRKSKYGGLNSRTFDYRDSGKPTPSYRFYPNDYPHSLFVTNPGQTDADHAVLNSRLLCVGLYEDDRDRRYLSLEAYDGVIVRQNRYEAEMFAIEDERFEVDMAIERNAQTMRQIEPFAEEVQKLREQEEKDGQPIGRLQYQLNRFALDTINVNAIARIYGDKGDEVLQHMLQNPLITLPIVYQRLKQKDKEWREVKMGLNHRWNAANEVNYEGSLDALSPVQLNAFESRFTKSHLLDDCKRARTYSLAPQPTDFDSFPAFESFAPSYSLSCQDTSSLLFQPYVTVQCTVNAGHKDAFRILSTALKASGVSKLDRERVGRIWAEFMMPWFDYPAHWVVDEVRGTYSGTIGPSVVKYALGQRVVTQFGAGLIQSCVTQGEVVSYRVKLPFGVAYLSPSAVLHSIPSKETPYVRRDGNMVKDTSLLGSGTSPSTSRQVLGDDYEILFGTESIYLFLRLYLLLCSMLQTIRDEVDTHGVSGDPTLHYVRPSSRHASHPDDVRPRLDYSTFLTAALEFFSLGDPGDAASSKDFERVGRMVCKDKMFLISALPRLVDRCVQALVETAKEDVLLPLYDYCQYRQSVDPVSVRTHCFSLAPAALYRIQYDTVAGAAHFNYLPRSVELVVTSPSAAVDASSSSRMDVTSSEGDPVDDVSSEEDNNANNNNNAPDANPSSRPAKRART